MKGYTIQHSIELLEEEVKNGGGSGGPTTAENVSYDNTDSGLTAETVQAAIDEIDGALDTATGNITTLSGKVTDAGSYSTTEKEIGTWIDGRPVYRKVIDVGAYPNATSKNVAHGITDLDVVISVDMFAGDSQRTGFLPGMYCAVDAAFTNYSVQYNVTNENITIVTGQDRSAYSGYAVIVYVKTAPVTNTRKKK